MAITVSPQTHTACIPVGFPQLYGQQEWQIILSGVAEVNFPAATPDPSSSGRQETLSISFDLKDAFARMGWPLPGFHGFQVAQSVPFVAINSVFGAPNVDWSVSALRIRTVTRYTQAYEPVTNLYSGMEVDIAVPDTGPRATTVSSHLTLVGRVRRYSAYR